MAIDPVRDIIGVIVSAANALYALDRVRRRRTRAAFMSGDQPVLAEFAALE